MSTYMALDGPASVVTISGPAKSCGVSCTWISVSDQEITESSLPLNVTVGWPWMFPKLEPVMM